MKRIWIVASILSVAFMLQCASGANDGRRDATSVGADGWVFEGWACAPDTAEALIGYSPAKYCED